MNNKELKSCPFCGGEAKLKEYVDPYDSCIWSTEVFCTKCRAIMYGDENDAINAWNKRNYLEKQDSSNSSEIPNSSKELMEFIKFCRNASATDIRQIHDRARDLIAEHKECCEKYCKDESATLKPLVPKWADIGGGRYYLEVTIMQAVKMIFEIKYDTEENPLLYTLKAFFTVWDSECDYEEEIGWFNDLEGAKSKANECIKELGERLVYFANNIKTEKEK